ncbi:RVT_2 domain-containing protein [Senna tora]|uniref:RVT_2 domain-containing protein n=1 Tax=Senna tora TaxID=362788 RepID=A0A834XCE6_9FABA|nr:RVT_2 domain-containing protein [Senna tora]
MTLNSHIRFVPHYLSIVLISGSHSLFHLLSPSTMSSMPKPKRKTSKGSLAEGSKRLKVEKPKIFEDEVAPKRFAELFDRGITTLREERVYPVLVREFHANLSLDPETLEGKILLHGKKMKLNPGVLSHLISVPSEGIQLYSTRGEIEFESYGKSGFIWELTGKHCQVLDPSKLSPNDRILLHLVNQVVIPKLNKSNPATHLENFYMWCISKLRLLDLPFIILRHMTVALKQKGELPYKMVITKIAQYMGIDLSSYEFEIAKAQANYDLRLQLNMGYLKVGNEWVRKKEETITPKPPKIKTCASSRPRLTRATKSAQLSPTPQKHPRDSKSKEPLEEPIIEVSEEEGSSNEMGLPKVETALSNAASSQRSTPMVVNKKKIHLSIGANSSSGS